jgi:hypothetical protein
MIAGSVNEATVVGINEKKAPKSRFSTLSTGSSELIIAGIQLTRSHASENDESDQRSEGITDGPNDQHA